MIVVKVELWKRGNPNDVVKLDAMCIANDGTGTQARGNYVYSFAGKDPQRTMGEGSISDWPRKRRHVWDLIKRALDDAGR